jgi:hypothetical protein
MIDTGVRPGSPSKRARTSSSANGNALQPQQALRPQNSTLIKERFKQPESLLGPPICSLCERNITKSVKIVCAECNDVEKDYAAKNELVMCLECLRVGKTTADFPEHKADHAYYVYDSLQYPLFCNEWSAYEEIRLIQGIMKCGLGNWQDISEQFVKGQTPKECETHYFSVLMKQSEGISYASAITMRALNTKKEDTKDKEKPSH